MMRSCLLVILCLVVLSFWVRSSGAAVASIHLQDDSGNEVALQYDSLDGSHGLATEGYVLSGGLNLTELAASLFAQVTDLKEQVTNLTLELNKTNEAYEAVSAKVHDVRQDLGELFDGTSVTEAATNAEALATALTNREDNSVLAANYILPKWQGQVYFSSMVAGADFDFLYVHGDWAYLSPILGQAHLIRIYLPVYFSDFGDMWEHIDLSTHERWDISFTTPGPPQAYGDYMYFGSQCGYNQKFGHSMWRVPLNDFRVEAVEFYDFDPLNNERRGYLDMVIDTVNGMAYLAPYYKDNSVAHGNIMRIDLAEFGDYTTGVELVDMTTVPEESMKSLNTVHMTSAGWVYWLSYANSPGPMGTTGYILRYDTTAGLPFTDSNIEWIDTTDIHADLKGYHRAVASSDNYLYFKNVRMASSAYGQLIARVPHNNFTIGAVEYFDLAALLPDSRGALTMSFIDGTVYVYSRADASNSYGQVALVDEDRFMLPEYIRMIDIYSNMASNNDYKNYRDADIYVDSEGNKFMVIMTDTSNLVMRVRIE